MTCCSGHKANPPRFLNCLWQFVLNSVQCLNISTYVSAPSGAHTIVENTLSHDCVLGEIKIRCQCLHQSTASIFSWYFSWLILVSQVLVNHENGRRLSVSGKLVAFSFFRLFIWCHSIKMCKKSDIPKNLLFRLQYQFVTLAKKTSSLFPSGA